MKIFIFCALFLAAASPTVAGRFDVSALSQRLQQTAGLSSEQTASAQSTLDDHAKRLEDLAATAQSHGLAQLPQTGQDLEAAQKDLEKSLDGILDSADLQKLEGLHQQLGAELRAQVLDGAAGDVLKDLKLTGDETQALKPIVSTHLEALGKMFDSAWKTGGLAALPDLRKTLESQQSRLDTQLAAVLKPEQMQAFQTRRQQMLDRFEDLLGGQEVTEILSQLGELGQHQDEVASILQDGFKAKADQLKAMQPDLQKQAQSLLGGMDEVDTQVREKVQGLLGEQAGQALGQLQKHKRTALLSRLGR